MILFALLLSAALVAPASSLAARSRPIESRRPKASIIEEYAESGVHERFFRALAAGEIKYSILADSEKKARGLDFDFQVALKIWLKSLELDVNLVRVGTPESADIIVSLSRSPRFLSGRKWPGAAFFYTTPHERRGEGRPVIEVRESDFYPVVSIPEALARSGEVPIHRGGRVTDKSINDFLGHANKPEAIAEHLVRHNWKLWDGLISVPGKDSRVIASILVHELGHAFGLNDLYAESRPGWKEPRYSSVMKAGGWIPFAPTYVDRNRVLKLLAKASCSRLLLAKEP